MFYIRNMVPPMQKIVLLGKCYSFLFIYYFLNKFGLIQSICFSPPGFQSMIKPFSSIWFHSINCQLLMVCLTLEPDFGRCRCTHRNIGRHLPCHSIYPVHRYPLFSNLMLMVILTSRHTCSSKSLNIVTSRQPISDRRQ